MCHALGMLSELDNACLQGCQAQVEADIHYRTLLRGEDDPRDGRARSSASRAGTIDVRNRNCLRPAQLKISGTQQQAPQLGLTPKPQNVRAACISHSLQLTPTQSLISASLYKSVPVCSVSLLVSAPLIVSAHRQLWKMPALHPNLEDPLSLVPIVAC